MGAGGTGNIKKILHTLLNLRYKKITAIFDGDKKEEYEDCRKVFPQYNILILSIDDIRDKKEYYRNEKLGVVNDVLEIKPDLEGQLRELMHTVINYHGSGE